MRKHFLDAIFFSLWLECVQSKRKRENLLILIYYSIRFVVLINWISMVGNVLFSVKAKEKKKIKKDLYFYWTLTSWFDGIGKSSKFVIFTHLRLVSRYSLMIFNLFVSARRKKKLLTHLFVIFCCDAFFVCVCCHYNAKGLIQYLFLFFIWQLLYHSISSFMSHCPCCVQIFTFILLVYFFFFFKRR